MFAKSTYGFLFFTFALIQILAWPAAAEQVKQWQRIDINKKASLRGSAIKENTLWVSGSDNTVFVSFDAGKSWHDRSVKTKRTVDFRDIELFNKNTAIVMGAGEGQKSVLYKTINAGVSWQLLNVNSDDKGFYDAIAFWDEQNGLLLGDPVDGFYVIKRTLDGGKTWRRIAKVNLPALLDKEAAFAASGNTLITGKNGQAWLTTGGFSASVYFSDDYGEHWQRQDVPLYSATQTAGGYGLTLNSQQQVFVLGGDYQQRTGHYENIAGFLDGKWRKIDAKQRGLRTAMSCIEKVCISVGKTSTDISFDGGKVWQEFDDKTAELQQRGFYTIASDGQLFLAAGQDGKVAIYDVE